MSAIARIPQCSIDVTNEWLHQTLLQQCFQDAEHIEVNSIESLSNKFGVLSSTFKADATVANQDGCKVNYKFFIKIMPEPDTPERKFIEEFCIDAKEILTYKELMPRLQAFEEGIKGRSDIPSMIPKFYAGDVCMEKENRGYYVILQDLTPEYQMFSLDGGLSQAQIINALEKLAYFHGLTYSFRKQNSDAFEGVGRFPYRTLLETDMFKGYIDAMFDMAKDELAAAGHDNLASVISQLAKNSQEVFLASFDDLDEALFLSHGDMWANNLMFNKANDCLMIDWQFTMPTSAPFLDFSAIAYLSCSPDETKANLEAMYDAYYSKLDETCQNLGQVKLPWTKEEYVLQVESRGFLDLFVWMLFSYDTLAGKAIVLQRFVWIFEQTIQHNFKKSIVYRSYDFKIFLGYPVLNLFLDNFKSGNPPSEIICLPGSKPYKFL